jgi:hypothetical protein
MANDDYTPSGEVLEAARRLIPERGSGIDSVTISTSGMGGRSVTLTPEDSERFDRARGIDADGGDETSEWGEDAADLGRIVAARQRRAWLVIDANPAARMPLPEFKQIWRPDDFPLYLSMGESGVLAEIGNGLIARINRRYAPLEKLNIAYLWAADLGKEAGLPRLWRLKKADAFSRWALGHVRDARLVDLFLFLNSTVALRSAFTFWQAQGAIHTALDCVKVRDGQVQIAPQSALTRDYIIARYGAWTPDLEAIGKAIAASEGEQLPLWEETEDDEE